MCCCCVFEFGGDYVVCVVDVLGWLHVVLLACSKCLCCCCCCVCFKVFKTAVVVSHVCVCFLLSLFCCVLFLLVSQRCCFVCLGGEDVFVVTCVFVSS